MNIKTIERKRLKFEDDYTYLGRNMLMDEHPEYIHKSLLEYFKKEDLHQYPSMWKPPLNSILPITRVSIAIIVRIAGFLYAFPPNILGLRQKLSKP